MESDLKGQRKALFELYSAISAYNSNLESIFEHYKEYLNTPIVIVTCGEPDCECTRLEYLPIQDPLFVANCIKNGQCENRITEKEETLAGVNLVHVSVLNLNKHAVQLLIEYKCDFNVRTKLIGDTPLLVLLKMDNNSVINVMEDGQLMEMLDLLLRSNADVNMATTPDGDSPLIIAVEKRSINEVRRLLAVDNIDLEYKTPEPWCHTALSYSIIFQSQDKCKLLLEKGADVNVRGRDGFTPLLQAIGLGANFLQLLIDFGAHVNAKSDHDFTPLSYAIESGFLDEIQCLLANGADPNLAPHHMNQIPLLAYTCMYTNSNVTLELLKYGADVNVLYKSCNCLHLAQQPEVTRALLEAGLHPDSRTVTDNNTPLSIACFNNLFEVAKTLLEATANVNHVDDDGDTPLHYATYNNNENITQLLLSYGADPHVVNSENTSPVWNAVYRGNLNMVINFLRRNVSLDIISRGTKHIKGAGYLYDQPMSLLHVAVLNNYGKVAELLARCICNLNREHWLDEFAPEFASHLNQEHVSLYEKMKTIKSNIAMPSLLRLCVFSVRSYLSRNIDYVQELNIPSSLKDKICLIDVFEK